ncbi:tol-pal system-associated acyl-CoA thioesterase [Paraburkholderia sacchari]|uniref:tol-pal system-associated acyl-CoA thioesterase n=1 Tax=Paraburkholderia sacchari TaxID=159450 RepID=UPI000542A600|nr:tol-pal system-associated acyl-CoA thioesterase [Paraburkholderia sacchari]NLP62164.1 tol-pal system-associated acyl-CoA thioesterase [Paraburkholderia sacchari]
MRGMERSTRTPDATPSQAAAGFTWPVRVYYEDTDAGGIVFYANYLKFFERARTEWLRACGVDQRKLAEESGELFVVCNTTLDYKSPARLDDAVTIVTRIAKLGRVSVDFMQTAWRGDTLLVSGKIRVACVNGAEMRPAPIPDHVFEALERGMKKVLPAVSTAPQ